MPQITDQPTTNNNVQKRQRKRQKETQNTDGNKTDPHPAQNDLSNNIYYKTLNQHQQNHRIRTANTTRGGYIYAFTGQFFAYQSVFSLCTCIKIIT